MKLAQGKKSEADKKMVGSREGVAALLETKYVSDNLMVRLTNSFRQYFSAVLAMDKIKRLESSKWLAGYVCPVSRLIAGILLVPT